MEHAEFEVPLDIPMRMSSRHLASECVTKELENFDLEKMDVGAIIINKGGLRT